jgi:hypothetical protein
MHDDRSERVPDARGLARSNMYVAGQISWERSSSPAKIRNMSPAGALVQAPVVPPVGCPVRLARGSQRADGRVAWTEQDRCGIQFDSLVSVREWMAPHKNREQVRVDETVALLRAGAVPLVEAQRQRVAEDVSGELLPATQIAADLRGIARLLDQLSAHLANDPAVLQHHGNTLQGFDVASQSIEAVIHALTSEPSDSALICERLRGLRNSRASLID